MKHKLQKIICNEVMVTNEKLMDKVAEQRQLIELLKAEKKELEKCIEWSNKLLRDGEKVWGIEKTNNGEFLVSKVVHTNEPTFADKNFEYYLLQPGNYFNVLAMFLDYYEDEKKINIVDIQIGDDNCSKGYGTLAMKYLFNLVDAFDVEQITGNQYTNSEKNRKRQEKFYPRFFFDLKDGKISWKKSLNKHPFI